MTPEEFAASINVAQLDLRQIMSRVVLTVEREVKRVTPVKTGTLRRSITHRVEGVGERGVVGTNLKYAIWVHEGTKKKNYLIRPKSKKALFWKGAEHPVGAVRHPGLKGKPFFTEGFEAAKPAVNDILGEAGEKLVGEIAR